MAPSLLLLQIQIKACNWYLILNLNFYRILNCEFLWHITISYFKTVMLWKTYRATNATTKLKPWKLKMRWIKIGTKISHFLLVSLVTRKTMWNCLFSWITGSTVFVLGKCHLTWRKQTTICKVIHWTLRSERSLFVFLGTLFLFELLLQLQVLLRFESFDPYLEKNDGWIGQQKSGYRFSSFNDN